ncbi:MAG: hypothetical protein COT15_00380 [Candidatus Diapherotrites archaeon CG08_land_8_20_14_0_20_34_12]|nr:MAG: hypothetical protein COT15_00380 [Candidatus Diapherotrites archaeon CG08_land_8_20_14_0_20_34_12]
MNKNLFPIDWHSSFFECQNDILSQSLKYQEKSVELFGKVNLIHEVNLLKNRIKILEQQKDKKIFEEVRKLSNYEAENEIELFIQEKKERGIQKLNILDLVAETHLPPGQIEKIMKKLSSKGIREVHE